MAMPGAIGYVVINFDGIPVKVWPEDESNKAVQISALIVDLVTRTKVILSDLFPNDIMNGQF